MAVLFLLCFFLSCDSDGSNNSVIYSKDDYTAFELGRFAGLDEDTEWQIVQAHFKKLQSKGKKLTINDVWVEKYIGAYCPPYIGWTIPANEWDWEAFYYGAENQTVCAVMMGTQGQAFSPGQEVSMGHWRGRTFVRGGNNIFLWHDGRLYNLEDHFNYYPYLVSDYAIDLLFTWDFLKIVNLQNGLDFKTQIRILEDWGKSMPTPWIPGYYNEMPIQYLGTYNGYIVIFAYISSNAAVFHLEIDGVHFYTPSGGSGGNRIFAWEEGRIYTLQGLYEQGLITHDDLVTMAYNLHGIQEEY
jgi:hypothetical protein